MSVLIYSHQGSTSVHISASINDSGGLVLEGQDFGEAPERLKSHDDYEYQVSVAARDVAKLREVLIKHLGDRAPAAGADAGTLELVETAFGGRNTAVSDLRELCDAGGVPCEFFCWP